MGLIAQKTSAVSAITTKSGGDEDKCSRKTVVGTITRTVWLRDPPRLSGEPPGLSAIVCTERCITRSRVGAFLAPEKPPLEKVIFLADEIRAPWTWVFDFQDPRGHKCSPPGPNAAQAPSIAELRLEKGSLGRKG